ncbi:MAG: pectate lyase, partial [Bacteroidia bacterium]
ATATTTQTVCENVSIDNITYSITNATGATVVGLPTGVTGVFTSGVFTISGTSTEPGTFNYTVTTSGGCSPDATAMGTITVLPVSAITLTSATATTTQTVCENVSIDNIAYNIT